MNTLKSKINFISENGNTLIIVIAIIISLGVLGFVVGRLVISENRIAAIDADKNKAFYIAESGLEYAIGLLSDSSNWRATQKDISVGDGTFNVTVDDNTTMADLGDTLLVTVTATSASFVKSLQARLIPGVGESWSTAMLAGDNLDLNKGKGKIKGNLHSNNKYKVGSKYNVDGEITKAPPTVNLPVIDWNVFKNAAIAAGQYSTSDINFKTSDMPITGVWYTTKKMKIEDNNIVINGTIVAEEDIEIKKNNVEIYATPNNYPAVVAGHDFKVDFNNTVIEGVIYAEHDVIFEKNNGTIKGAVIAKNKLLHKGNNLDLTLEEKYTAGLVGVTIDSTILIDEGMQLVRWIEN